MEKRGFFFFFQPFFLETEMVQQQRDGKDIKRMKVDH